MRTYAENQAVCDALNKLFWKIESFGEGYQASENIAAYIVEELADCPDPFAIRWNDEVEEFEPMVDGPDPRD